MIKRLKLYIRKLAKKFHLLIADDSRIGIELENDLLRLSASDPILTVFDVGANLGLTTKRFLMSFPLARVYSFEPVLSNYQIISSIFSKHPRVCLHNLGLAREPGELVIGLSDSSGEHSFLLGKERRGDEVVRVTSVDHYVTQNKIKRIDLLKIDVEGFEIDVLEGARLALQAESIRYIYAECIFAEDCSRPHTLFSELTKYLNGHGFCIFACYHESFNLATGSAMANVLYANMALLPGRVSGRVRNIYNLKQPGNGPALNLHGQ